MKIPVNCPSILPYYNVFHNTVKSPRFGTLEPPRSGRKGGRGKGKRSMKRAPKRCAHRIFSFEI
jgi:hypothetical protein